MKKVNSIFWCLIFTSILSAQSFNQAFLQIKKIKQDYGIEIIESSSFYNKNNNILMLVVGGTNITDSIVYEYSNCGEPQHITHYCATSINPTLHICSIESFINTKYMTKESFWDSLCFDEFKLYDELSFKEVDRLYGHLRKISRFEDNSEGYLLKIHYTIGAVISVSLPYLDKEGDVLDSVNVYTSGGKIIKEEYYFDVKRIIREYNFENLRLNSYNTTLRTNEGQIDSIKTWFKYKYLIDF